MYEETEGGVGGREVAGKDGGAEEGAGGKDEREDGVGERRGGRGEQGRNGGGLAVFGIEKREKREKRKEEEEKAQKKRRTHIRRKGGSVHVS